jgi:uncharacterized protein (TIRG00374 family)
MKKTAIRLSIIFFLTFVFLYFFFQSVDWKAVLANLINVNPKFFVLLILLTPLHMLTRSIRWRYLLLHQKKEVSLANRFAANAVGFTVTLIFPGRLGELVKPIYLAQKEKMRKGFVMGTVLVERTFDVLINCLLLGLFLLSRPLYSSYFRLNDEGYSNLQFWGTVGVILFSILIVLILAIYFFREKALATAARLLKPFPQKVSKGIHEFLTEFIRGLKFFHSLGNLLIYTFFSFVVWLGIIFYYWIFFYAYKIPISYFLLFPYNFLLMVGASIPTPGMVGGYDYFSRIALTSLYNIDASKAVSMTIVVHAIQVVVTCLIGYTILWKEGISLFQLKKLGEVAEE